MIDAASAEELLARYLDAPVSAARVVLRLPDDPAAMRPPCCCGPGAWCPRCGTYEPQDPAASPPPRRQPARCGRVIRKRLSD